ncbi:MAG: ATP synthase F0 subunit C [Candidatus Binatota bacterium]
MIPGTHRTPLPRSSVPAAAAMESIGPNPNAADRIFTPMIIGLAFIEALAIYALLIAFLLQLKI